MLDFRYFILLPLVMTIQRTIVLTEEELRQVVRTELLCFRQGLKELITPQNTKQQLNAKEAAEFLGISLSTLYKKVEAIPHKKFGKKLLFNRQELEGVRF